MEDKTTIYYDIPSLCQIADPKKFQRSLKYWGKVWHKYNADKKLKVSAYYPFVVHNSYPSWTASSGMVARLEVDVSLPKVVYGNNLYELDDGDFNTVCQVISDKLKVMGINIVPKCVCLGVVQQIEYSKNIPTGRVPVPYILREIAIGAPKSKLDIERVAYRNGEGLYFYCKSYDVMLYDKGAEILNQIKGNTFPPQLVQNLQSGAYNILRMEVRFHNRKTLMDFLHGNGFPNNCGLLKDVYSKTISQHVITHYWNILSQSVRENSPSILSPAFELWKIHQGGGLNLTAQQALAKLGARYLIREHGYKGAIHALERIGYSNPAQILQSHVKRIFKPFWKLDICRFIDHSLARFVCLGPSKWTKLKIRSDGPWFRKKEPLIKLAEAAKWLNVSIRTLRKEIKALRLKAIKIGRAYQIHRYNLLEYMNA